MTDNKWTANHITQEVCFVAWDESGVYELGRFKNYKEAKDAILAYSKILDNELNKESK